MNILPNMPRQLHWSYNQGPDWYQLNGMSNALINLRQFCLSTQMKPMDIGRNWWNLQSKKVHSQQRDQGWSSQLEWLQKDHPAAGKILQEAQFPEICPVCNKVKWWMNCLSKKMWHSSRRTSRDQGLEEVPEDKGDITPLDQEHQQAIEEAIQRKWGLVY